MEDIRKHLSFHGWSNMVHCAGRTRGRMAGWMGWMSGEKLSSSMNHSWENIRSIVLSKVKYVIHINTTRFPELHLSIYFTYWCEIVCGYISCLEDADLDEDADLSEGDFHADYMQSPLNTLDHPTLETCDYPGARLCWDATRLTLTLENAIILDREYFAHWPVNDAIINVWEVIIQGAPNHMFVGVVDEKGNHRGWRGTCGSAMNFESGDRLRIGFNPFGLHLYFFNHRTGVSDGIVLEQAVKWFCVGLRDSCSSVQFLTEEEFCLK